MISTLYLPDATGLCSWSGKWYLLIDSLFQLASLNCDQGSIFCSKIRKLSIAPQEIKAISSSK